MQKPVRRLLAILDGKPSASRGQSLVELSLTLPIFLILLIGLVEIGWFANNYLILSDVVRSAGRFGSIRDPLDFPPSEIWNQHRHDCDVNSTGGATTFNNLPTELNAEPPFGVGNPRFPIGLESEDLGFYDGVACAAISNMAPLEFKDDPAEHPEFRDDVVVSVFSYAVLTEAADCGGSAPCIRVTGRYPHQANECSVDDVDPFDIDRDNQADANEDPVRFDNVGATNEDEGYRGYVYRGNQETGDDDTCLGSQFDVAWMEEQLTRIVVPDCADPEDCATEYAQVMTLTEIGLVPNHGLVLVEIQWYSYQLLGLPVFSWMANPLRIHIWGIFPVSAAEPDLD